jgi:hypothetical protein
MKKVSLFAGARCPMTRKPTLFLVPAGATSRTAGASTSPSGAPLKSVPLRSTCEVREDDLVKLITTGIIPPRIWLQLSAESKASIEEDDDD